MNKNEEHPDVEHVPKKPGPAKRSGGQPPPPPPSPPPPSPPEVGG